MKKKSALGFTGLVLFATLSILAAIEYIKKAGIDDIFEFGDEFEE
jgi:hypothetical protein